MREENISYISLIHKFFFFKWEHLKFIVTLITDIFLVLLISDILEKKKNILNDVVGTYSIEKLSSEHQTHGWFC